MDILTQMVGIRDKIPYFLAAQYHNSVKGYFKYSYSGDLYGGDIHWGLGSAAMALKLAYTVGLPKSDAMIADAIAYIKSFEHKNGYFYDDLIYRKSFGRNLRNVVKHGQYDNLFNERYKRAESRQSSSSLLLFEEFPQCLPDNIIYTGEWMEKFLEKLNWSYPWEAGSHFSHLLFYLNLAYKMQKLSEQDFIRLRQIIIGWVGKMQSEETGSWYLKEPSPQQKINGAMKVITGYNIVDYTTIRYSEKLIDLCLDSINNEQACDNFNIIYVLHYASCNCPGYRQKEIEEFAEKRFAIYLGYYHEKQGGFSFLPDGANQFYYNAKITEGKNEADIHGTTLFMWGISIISKILNIDEEVGIYEFKS